MENFLKKLKWGIDPDVPDPVSGLSKRDLYEIQKTWAPIYEHAGDYGIELFKRFFLAEPDAQNLFATVKGMNEDEITESNAFRAQVINFMSSWNQAIMNLKQPVVVTAMMHRIGSTHKRNNVPKKYFEMLKQVLVDFLQSDIKVGPKVLASFGRMLDFFYSQIFVKLEEN